MTRDEILKQLAQGDASAQVILIAGATASGKSSFALQIAEQTGGVIINCDSMQIYNDLRILSARPSREDERRAPHKLYGFLDGAEKSSVGRWLKEAASALAQCRSGQQTAIFVGGTGLYFKTLNDGLAAMPDISSATHEKWVNARDQKGAQHLFDMLKEKDPAAAEKIGSSDPQRLQRALEIFEETGTSILDWQKQNQPALLNPDEAKRFVIMRERETLYQRINQRFDQMIDEGAITEVESLLSKNLDPQLPVMRAIGVPQIARYLAGEISRNEAIEKAKTATRHYAKRQMTWFRHQMADWHSLEK